MLKRHMNMRCIISRKFVRSSGHDMTVDMNVSGREVRWLSIKLKYALMVPRISSKIQRNHESDFGYVRLVACFALEFARLKFIHICTRRTLWVPSVSFDPKKILRFEVRICDLLITMEEYIYIYVAKLNLLMDNLYSKISINLW